MKDLDLDNILGTKKSQIIVKFDLYKKLYFENDIVGYTFEKLGYNTSLKNFVDIISEQIFQYINNKKGYGKIHFPLIIKEIGTTNIIINFNRNFTNISRNGENLEIDFEYDIYNPYILQEIKPKIDHELHHIFINMMGNKTHRDYFVVNDLVNKYENKTKAFLTLYYLAFPDEINSNIQMFFKEIGNNNIKNKKDFEIFLNNYQLYKIAKKMVDINIDDYWNEIIKEGNDKELLHKLHINNLKAFLEIVSKKIKKAGKKYIRNLSRVF